MRIVTALGAAVALAAPGAALRGACDVQEPIPYVATRSDAVRDMLWIAAVGKDDLLYDLGSGDGRIAIAAVRDFGARRAIGVEHDPALVHQSVENARRDGVAGRVEFREADLFKARFEDATVVTLFLGHGPNLKLRPKLVGGLKPGTRVVSHQFGMGEWQADKEFMVRTEFLGMQSSGYNPYRDNPHVPDFTGNESHFGHDRITMWVVPAHVAGNWLGTVETAQGLRACRVTLHQSLAGVRGTLKLDGEDAPAELQMDLWGDHVRWWRPGPTPVRFDGHVDGDTLRGTMLAGAGGQGDKGRPWSARRAAADLTGTWEWQCLTGDHPVRLRVERRDGQAVATYIDRDKQIPIEDFYDFGGGFYFTLLVGRGGQGLTVNKDTGWLIGKGVVDAGALEGAVAFYPYRAVPGASGPPGGATQEWHPRPIGVGTDGPRR